MLDSGEVELLGAQKLITEERARLAYTLVRDGVTYTVFEDLLPDDSTVSGLMIQPGAGPTATLTCPQKGPLAGLDEHLMPTVFSELLRPER